MSIKDVDQFLAGELPKTNGSFGLEWANRISDVRALVIESVLRDDDIVTSFKPAFFLGFEMTLIDETTIFFDWDRGDGALFHVRFKDRRPQQVQVTAGPPGLGRKVEWIELLYRHPVELCLHVMQIARQQCPDTRYKIPTE